MITTVNTLASINLIQGTWQSNFGLLLAAVYAEFNYLPDNREVNFSMGSTCHMTLVIVICYHTFVVLSEVNLVFQVHFHSILSNVLVLIGNIFQIFSLAQVVSTAYALRSPILPATQKT